MKHLIFSRLLLLEEATEEYLPLPYSSQKTLRSRGVPCPTPWMAESLPRKAKNAEQTGFPGQSTSGTISAMKLLPTQQDRAREFPESWRIDSGEFY